jgi:ComF family protein
MEIKELTTVKDRILDILFPPQCLSCSIMVGETGTLCSNCWQKISFLEGACCQACGLPFEFDLGPDAFCGACSQNRPLFRRARAAMIYNEASRDLILSFKHGDRTNAAAAYGKWLYRTELQLVEENDLLLPVPLHWSRLFHRRYNQAALLAVEIGKICKMPVETSLLLRPKKTASQGHKTPNQRYNNLRGAFSVPVQAETKLKGKRVLLVDDVFTTGATVSACSKTLLQAGVKSVDVLTLARVVRTETSQLAER